MQEPHVDGSFYVGQHRYKAMPSSRSIQSAMLSWKRALAGLSRPRVALTLVSFCLRGQHYLFSTDWLTEIFYFNIFFGLSGI